MSMARVLFAAVALLVVFLTLLILFAWMGQRKEPRWREALDQGSFIRLPAASIEEDRIRRRGRHSSQSPSSSSAGVEKFEVPPPPALTPAKPASPTENAPKTGPEKPSSTLWKRPPFSKEQLAPSVDVRSLVHQAKASYLGLAGYTADIRREERGMNDLRVREVIRVNDHRASGEVVLEWLDGHHAGRRVVYDARDPVGTMDVILGHREPRFLGRRASLARHHWLVRFSGGQPASTFGIGPWVQRLNEIVESSEKGDGRLGRLIVSIERPDDVPNDSPFVVLRQEADQHATEAMLPPGGYREWRLEPGSRLPFVVIGRDEAGQIVDACRVESFEKVEPLHEKQVTP